MRDRLSSSGQPLHVFAAAEGETIELESGRDTGATHSATEFSAVTPIAAAISEYSIFLGATDAHTAEVIRDAAAAENVRLISGTSTETALQIIATDRPSLVIVDEQSVGDDAVEICRKVKESDLQATVQTPIVVLTDREHTASELAEFDADWMIRPFSHEYARTRIRACILQTTCRWIRASLPENEAARLAALDELEILDSAPEERYDRIVRIASEAFDVPIALVSLVDRDRQWFKSCIGLDVKETPRDMAFCAHAILEDEVLIVPDAFLDPRFADNPLVTGEPHVRFYAGCPLKLPDGNLMGTLCLIDTRPRQLDDGKINLLRDLGKLTEIELSEGPGQNQTERIGTTWIPLRRQFKNWRSSSVNMRLVLPARHLSSAIYSCNGWKSTQSMRSSLCQPSHFRKHALASAFLSPAPYTPSDPAPANDR